MLADLTEKRFDLYTRVPQFKCCKCYTTYKNFLVRQITPRHVMTHHGCREVQPNKANNIFAQIKTIYMLYEFTSWLALIYMFILHSQD